MKKITLIACAAVLAGLLVSCNNGAKDYNNVTYTDTQYNYLVKGTRTVVTETASKRYDADDKQDNGSSLKKTETYTIVSTPAYVHINESEQADYNFDSYYINVSNSTGYYESVANSGTEWDGTKEVDLTATQLDTYKVEKAATPGTNVTGLWEDIYKIDGKIYLPHNDKYFEVTVDEDKLAAGEDFTLSVSVVTTDTTSNDTEFDSDGKQKRRTTSSNKITETYDLTFTAAK